jgi:hypothetical protein
MIGVDLARDIVHAERMESGRSRADIHPGIAAIRRLLHAAIGNDEAGATPHSEGDVVRVTMAGRQLSSPVRAAAQSRGDDQARLLKKLTLITPRGLRLDHAIIVAGEPSTIFSP